MVGNTIFEVLLGEQKVDWGIILQFVVSKLVENSRKQKATLIGSYLFYLYNGEIIAYIYTIGIASRGDHCIQQRPGFAQVYQYSGSRSGSVYASEVGSVTKSIHPEKQSET